VIVNGGVFFKESEPGTFQEDLDKVFRRWRRQQNTVTFVVECPKDRAAMIRAEIGTRGGHIL